jgi:hypothetical protein
MVVLPGHSPSIGLSAAVYVRPVKIMRFSGCLHVQAVQQPEHLPRCGANTHLSILSRRFGTFQPAGHRMGASTDGQTPAAVV